ncbi:MAG: hypothetical protein NWS72_01500, partial [Thermoleophilia bacterium]|nr:hypothetical protein [Thermoleophilia bacterium]
RQDGHSTTRNSPGVPRRWSRPDTTMVPPVIPHTGHAEGCVAGDSGISPRIRPHETSSLAGT